MVVATPSVTWNGPRSAYVHIPFCSHHCGYCNFTVIAGRGDLIENYLRALRCELAELKFPRPVDTLFLGGGTPTQLNKNELRSLLELTLTWFPLTEGGEFSVEANPADVETEKIDLLVAWGVNRISLGAQSFQSHKLKTLERDHDAAKIHQAVELASSRIASVSLDLIFGLPNESLTDWSRDLQAALALRPNHLSTYGLTYEKGTHFWSRQQRGQIQQLSEEAEREMFELAINHLTAAGLEHYEISNFARPNHRCRHNEAYWSGAEYYAAGAGASRFVNGLRETNHRSVVNYLRLVLSGKSPVAQREQLAPEDAAREQLVFGLRRLAGVDRNDFHRKTGFTIEALIEAPLDTFLKLGLLEWVQNRLRLTREGLMVSDSLWPAFL
ncbi:MAG: coproporphyrinogen III oxidase [Planctomycetaceae bacterium]|nr:coproporphyrinogen III oxidase [Planctomycetaceae bacterium]MBP63588.1 coproporphyrinogen III oxidase [Planctomycetaceae bacterium]